MSIIGDGLCAREGGIKLCTEEWIYMNHYEQLVKP